MTRDDHGDGRHIDRRLGELGGEAAGIAVRDDAWPIAPGITPAIGGELGERGALGDAPTYYDLPVVKMAPWKWYIPAYFAIGGLAGAAASRAGVLELTAPSRSIAERFGVRRSLDSRRSLARVLAMHPRSRGAGATRSLTHALHWIATAGEATGAALLIADLGRPARFHHMLRVFRPTSPMNLGTWILSTASATSGLGLLASLRDRRASPLINAAGVVSGTMLSTYTGVLIGNTAVPLWHATRRQLPLWFAALSAASLGSALELIAPAHPVTRVYSLAGKTAQLATGLAVAHAARTAGVDAPLRRQRGGSRSGALWRAAGWLGAAGLAASLWPTRDRRVAWLAGTLGLASTVIGRFAISEAGRASAADPRQTFTSQRAAGAGEASSDVPL